MAFQKIYTVTVRWYLFVLFARNLDYTFLCIPTTCDRVNTTTVARSKGELFDAVKSTALKGHAEFGIFRNSRECGATSELRETFFIRNIRTRSCEVL